jgi:uncharacterized protein YegP (UPF0339 family)
MEQIEVFKSEKDGQYYFSIKAANGLVIAQSEGYKDKRNCLKGLAAVEAAFKPPAPDVTDPNTPAAIAFAQTYSPLLSKWQAGVSSVVQQRNETTLAEIVLRALQDGWTVQMPGSVVDGIPADTSSVPVVEAAPEPEPAQAPKTRGRRKATTK